MANAAKKQRTSGCFADEVEAAATCGSSDDEGKHEEAAEFDGYSHGEFTPSDEVTWGSQELEMVRCGMETSGSRGSEEGRARTRGTGRDARSGGRCSNARRPKEKALGAGVGEEGEGHGAAEGHGQARQKEGLATTLVAAACGGREASGRGLEARLSVLSAWACGVVTARRGRHGIEEERLAIGLGLGFMCAGWSLGRLGYLSLHFSQIL
ncbi:hypothetical protein ZWY2020_027937 [Hordeum vulgare]|nr:hypothetical protein ZWY2020_027937 [Hordeum vulgare]